MSIAVLVARLCLGLGIAAHGTQKLFGWFGGPGLAGTAGYFETLGFQPGRLFATGAALAETMGGALVALGMFGPVGPGLVLLVMLVAATVVHARNGFFVAQNGIELPLLYGVGALLLAFTGPGEYSIDRMAGWLGWSSERNAALAVAAAVIGAALNVAARRTPVRSPAQTA